MPAGAPPVAVKFYTLFDQLRAADAAPKNGTRPHVAFKLSEAELTDYLRYSLKATPRPGLDSMAVKVFPENYISTFTVLDFDEVERWHPGTIPSLLKPVLNGKKTILLDYRISANDFKMTFSVEKAYYQEVHIPAFLVNEVLKIVAGRQPEHYDTGKPMPIPFGLKQLWTSEHFIEGQN